MRKLGLLKVLSVEAGGDLELLFGLARDVA